MKKTLFLTLFVFCLSISSLSSAQEQNTRSLEQLIDQYDAATSIEAFNQFHNSLTPEEEEILGQSETHSFIVDPTPPPGFESVEEFEQFVEEAENQPQSQGPETGATSCFDNYDFGSVQAKLFTGLQSTVAGSDLIINMEVTNDNPYPVVNGAVFLKVYRELDDTSRRTVDGDDLVDQFWAVRDISLNAGEQKEYAIKWTIPAFLRGGNYHIDSYVVSSDRYNLSGLTFTDDISGSKTFLNIRGIEEGVYFDKSSVTKNGEKHQFIAPISVESQTEPITVSVDIVNTTETDQRIEVIWNLSVWDGLLPNNFLDQAEKYYTIPANSRETISYTVSNNDHSVYYLSPVLKYEDTTSWLNIRFARENKNMARVNYPAVDTYPLTKDQTNKFFVCLHNAGSDMVVEDVLYKAEIVDKDDNIIYQYKREGWVTTDMMGFEENFTLKKDYYDFTIKSELYQDGKLIDSDELHYSCDDLSPENCPEDNNFRNILIGILSIIILLLISVKFLKKKNYE